MSERVEARHTSRCYVCQHPDKDEIEAKYLKFVPQIELAEDYALPEPALTRHFQYFGLHLKRANNTKRIQELIINKGVEALANDEIEIKTSDIVAASKHLDALEGRVQQKRENESDREAKRLHFNTAIENVIRRAKENDMEVTRDRAIELLEQHTGFEDIREYIN
jgi:hypothetical protein